MKTNIISYFAMSILCLFLSHSMTAQDKLYHSFDYMNVEPGNHQDYIALEKAWKKIHEYNIKEGNIVGWEFAKVLSPVGASVDYNYVTRTSVRAGKQFESFMESFPMPEDLSSILSPSELELVNRTGQLRTYVKNEIYSVAEAVLPIGYADSKIHVFNYFDHPKGGGRSAHIKVETDIWMPVHQARAEEDKLEGWVLAELELPFGADQPYHEVTVDMYKDMSQYMEDKSFGSYFEKVHPGKDTDLLMKQTVEAASLIKGEVRMIIDKASLPASTANAN